ncbi:MAG: ATP-binding protein [Capsulimonadales bacterium]|nr:ATP-binding protein [Capsulimonadales bacterium]
MRKSLRSQLLQSHLLLVGLLLGVCLIAVAGFFRLGQSVNRILEDNYKSVIAAQNMKEALERIDSASTFFVTGQREWARRQYRENLPLFLNAARIEADNITEVGEQEISDDLTREFARYRRQVEGLLFSTAPDESGRTRSFYFSVLQPQFSRVKRRVQDVLDLNQAAIVRADRRAREEARVAALASVLITALAVVLGLGWARRNIATLMTPLISLTRQAEEIGSGHFNQRIEARRDDEIGLLATTFNGMAERLQEARRREEERLHRAERLSDAALTDLYDPVIVTDQEGRVVRLNRAAEGLFGPGVRASGQFVQSVVQENRLAEAIRRAAREAQVSAEEGDAGLVSLAGRAYRLRATPIRDEDAMPLGAVAVLEDVTYQQEVGRLKTEFIGVASHELRTPVTSLLLGVDLLAEGAAGALLPAQREIVSVLREDLLRLERMMHELLDLTRLESGATPPRFEVVAPNELLTAARRSVEAEARTRNVILEATTDETLPPVRADRSQMVRVLINLASNAIRHTPAAGRVTLSANTEGDRVVFQVADTGSGIPPAYLERIFDRFVQVPGATRGGAGLGLSIAQTIVRAHGGEIRAQSEPGNGSVFRFSLPATFRDIRVEGTSRKDL